MRRTVAVALLAMFAVTQAPAAELAPFFEARRVGIAIGALQLPPELRRELTSGLTNRMLIRVTLLSGSRTLAQRAVEISVKYDLWDESFALTMRVGGAAVLERTYRDATEVLAVLANPRLPGLFASADFTAEPPFVVRADALLNPIDRERLEQIRKWVAENTAPAGAARGADAASASANAASNAIFNRIFEQYAAGTDMAASWNQSVSSGPFRPDELPRDRQ